MAEDQRFFFLDLTKAGVKGGSQKAGHVDWLELDNWDFSMSQTASANIKGGRPSKTAAVGSFSFTIKHNGPNILKIATAGTFLDSPVTFEAERGGLKGSAGSGFKTTGTYLQLVFQNVVVSSRSIAGDDGIKTENISLAFSNVQMTYRQVVSGQLGSALTSSYDAKSNQAQG
jgi:type VI protein secretion system component Hcp